jgi:serine/threonine-protein kinase
VQGGEGHVHDGGADLRSALPAYEIGPVLGSGAFAVVFGARHTGLDREVAVKVLASNLIADPEARERFAAEARLLASLDHPHIVRVYDYVDRDDVCALVMERMRGGTLAARVRLAPLTGPAACAVTLAALHGLEHAHRSGVLHRDIKPENLLFGERNLLKVADFGIAKVIGATGLRLTATAVRPGTPAFMAPEQVSSALGPLSTATDVWAMGAVIYELLSGAPPFSEAHELGDALLRRVNSSPRSLREVTPAVPEQVAAVVMRALRRNPGDRYPSAGDFAADLDAAVAQGYGAHAIEATQIPVHRTSPIPAGPHRPTLEEASPIDLLDAGPKPPSRWRPRAALAAAAVLGAIVAVVATLALGGDDGDGDAGSLAALPSPPPGWPDTMMLSYVDSVDGPAGVAERLGPAASTWELFDGDPVAKTDWSQDPSRSPAKFVRDSYREGVFPLAIYYSLRAVGRADEGSDAEAPELRETLVNRRLMLAYWRNVRELLQSLGSTDKPVAVTIESGTLALLQQQLTFSGTRPASVAARVGSSGLPELRGLPDNLPGFAQGWRALRNRYAPKVLLGVELDDYGANIDISRDLPPGPTVEAAAQTVGAFYLDVAANVFDYAGLEMGFSEEGANPSRTEIYSTPEKEAVVDFTRAFVRRTGIPVVLDGVPKGNTASRAITDRPFHWRDSWVQWLMGDDSFSGLTELRDAGAIGLVFSAGLGRYGTCPCDAAHDGVTNGGKFGEPSTSADDDGGYLAARAQALEAAGGIPLDE